MSDRELFDPGLQPERTALAWRRTVLALLVGSLLGGRLLEPALGARALLAGALGVAGAAAVLLLARRRARAVRAALAGGAGPLPGAGALALLAGLVTAGAVVALVAVLRAAAR